MSPLRTPPSTLSSLSSRLWRLSLFLLLSLPDAKGKAIWTALLRVTVQVGGRATSESREGGVFGNHSPLERVSGALALPEGWEQTACNPMTNFSRPERAGSWLALIERGGCTFTHKINVAAHKGAHGVIIYNYPGTGNRVFPMSHQGTEHVVAVMIGNLKGMELSRLVQKRVSVTITIEVGLVHMPLTGHCAVSLCSCLAATVLFLCLSCAWRRRASDASSRRRRQRKAEVRKAVSQLQLRVLREGDRELEPSGDRCVICFDVYKPQDVVRILTCRHLFHKPCIDPWLLAHRTCPVCKCNILNT